MAISDVLFDAQKQIEDYLALGWYDEPGDPLRDEIDALVKQMARVRVKLDTYPPLLGVEQQN